jgi:hypothetical protein
MALRMCDSQGKNFVWILAWGQASRGYFMVFLGSPKENEMEI